MKCNVGWTSHEVKSISPMATLHPIKKTATVISSVCKRSDCESNQLYSQVCFNFVIRIPVTWEQLILYSRRNRETLRQDSEQILIDLWKKVCSASKWARMNCGSLLWIGSLQNAESGIKSSMMIPWFLCERRLIFPVWSVQLLGIFITCSQCNNINMWIFQTLRVEFFS